MPVGCHDDEMPWGRDSDNILETKQLYGQYSLLCGLFNIKNYVFTLVFILRVFLIRNCLKKVFEGSKI